MHLTWLGWAGVELEAATGETLVIDALADPGAAFRVFGARVAGTPVPDVTPPASGRAVAGLVTHLHRDHADAGALAAALVPGAPVLEPTPFGGGAEENLGLAQANAELEAAGLARRGLAAWESTTIGPFAITALPAVDGFGDPQVSWLVEADGARVLHLGDTTFHGYWWRFAQRFGPIDVVLLPVNGAVCRFPHRRPASPLPAVLDPERAAIAAELVGARLAIPMHAEGYEIDGIYAPIPDAAAQFTASAAARSVATRTLALGESLDLASAAAGAPR